MPVDKFTVCVDDGTLTPLPGDYQRMSNARRAAVVAARETGTVMAVVFKGRVRLTVKPDGTCAPPSGAVVAPRDNCTRTDDGPPCFCAHCRADRKAGNA